jgi:hypothetical protein
MIQLLVTVQNANGLSTSVIECANEDHAGAVAAALNMENGDPHDATNYRVVQLPASLGRSPMPPPRHLGIDGAHQVGPYTIPQNPLRKPLIAGIRIDYLQAAVRALRDSAGRAIEPDGFDSSHTRAEDTSDWEAAVAIDTAITECQDHVRRYR